MATGKQWAVGCGLGCLSMILLSFGGCFLFGALMTAPFRSADTFRTELESTVGDQGSYTPPADGVIPVDRIEAFLRVREALQAPCVPLTEFGETIGDLEKTAEAIDAGKKKKREMFSSIFKLTGSVMGMAGDLGDFFAARNGALLENRMSLGEYGHIYLLAYNSQLAAHTPSDDEAFGSEHTVSRRVSRLLVASFKRQLDAARESGQSEMLIARLEAEIAAMEENPRQTPFLTGLPAEFDAPFLPFRDQLDPLYCPATRGFELQRAETRHGGLHIETR